ncbi:MAG: WbqC family protein, partial [Tannerella sp.]|nr:WbqC family protein [Tannerella sp.]
MLLSTAYFAPIQYYTKLAACSSVNIEIYENYPKQTYRNRCHIAGANGLQVLTVPVEKSAAPKCLTRDIRISEHGNWRHLHWNALVSAYNLSPFFEYYADDIRPFFEQKYIYLIDFNS